MEFTGTVKWFNDQRGYGFIERNSGPDLFVHHSAIQMDGYRTLQPGMTVAFEVEGGPHGERIKRVARLI